MVNILSYIDPSEAIFLGRAGAIDVSVKTRTMRRFANMDETLFGEDIDLSRVFGEEPYNPLEFIEGEDDEDWHDDDGHLLPDMLPPVEIGNRRHLAVYSPETTGSVFEALRNLVTVNAGRRTILLSIIEWAREGKQASALFRMIEDAQKNNLSIYEPISYCRMLERAGALRLELEDIPEGEALQESEEELAEKRGYLMIENDIDPIWRSSDEGLAAFEKLTQGNEWREKLFGEDSVYSEVYLAIMNFMLDEDRPKQEIVDLAETFEVTKLPLKYGMYFIDVLEATDAICWTGEAWGLSALGAKLLPELAEFNEQKKQMKRI